MKREYWVFIALLVVSVLNTVAFFTHPAWRYYKKNVDRVQDHLDARITEFQIQVADKFLPAVYEAITNNGVNHSSSVSVSTSPDAFVLPPSATNHNSITKSIEGSYFIAARRSYVDVNGFFLQVGDNFDGTPITSMSPYCITTRLNTYQLTKPRKEVQHPNNVQEK